MQLTETTWEIIEQAKIEAEDILSLLSMGLDVILCEEGSIVAATCQRGMAHDIGMANGYTVISCDDGTTTFYAKL